jgi:aldehyde:ferredoxin oxidoreductase
MSGTFNKFFAIDLSTGSINEKSVDPEYFKIYVGGSALAARLFLEEGGTDIAPMAPESPLFIMAGPLVGTTFPGSSRFVMCARSPLTGIWGESASGGTFGADMKKSGLDGIAVKGKAGRPVYICINDDTVSIENADDLWGKDTYETIDALKEKHSEDRSARVLAIGPAGENRVKFAAVSNDKAHYFGRCGMGAVMGSKNLKAVVVRSTGKVPIADEEAYKAGRKAALETIKCSMVAESMHELGTNTAMDIGMMTGDVPIKNWSIGGQFELGEVLGGPALVEKMLKRRGFCYACPIGCKPVVTVNTAEYRVEEGAGPEYETCGTFGTMLMNDNLFAVAHVNELCNRFGLDTISCGSTIAFVMEAYEKGLLSRDDLDGLDLTWGNMAAVVELIKKIAHRNSFGDRAAEGSWALSESMGEASKEFVVNVKGLELPMHDPRAFHGLGLAYMNSNRGACHLQHTVQPVEQGMVAWEAAGFEEDYKATESRGKANMVAIAEDLGQMANAVCVCHFVYWAMGPEHLLDGFNTVTGLKFDINAFMEVGRRAWVLKRALNNLMGVTEADDKLPKRVLTALTEGMAESSVPDEALMKNEYYEIRGLDERGFPLPELLDSLKLEFIKEKLY